MKFIHRSAIFIAFLIICFSINPQHLKAEISNDNELNNFTAYYYLHPRPLETPQALKYYLNSASFSESKSNPGTIDLMSYLYVKLAEMNPNLLKEYTKLYDSAKEDGRLFLLSIFKIYRDEQTENYLKERSGTASQHEKQIIQDVLSKPPQGSKAYLKGIEKYDQLDFFWIDFFLSGTKEPIVKLIDILSWKDRFREKLSAWMHAKHNSHEESRLESFLMDMGYYTDLGTERINFEGDFDCLYSSYLQGSGFAHKRSKPGIEIRKILNLTKDDLLYMATKGAAMWSLQSNAQQHAKVLEICRKELSSRNDKATIELFIIVKIASRDLSEKITLRGGLNSF